MHIFYHVDIRMIEIGRCDLVRRSMVIPSHLDQDEIRRLAGSYVKFFRFGSVHLCCAETGV